MKLKMNRGKIRITARRLLICLCAAAMLAVGIISPGLGFGASAEDMAPQKKMIHFENSGVQSGFGVKLDVEKDVSYNISFKYKLVSGSFVKDNGGGIALRLYKPDFSGVADSNYNDKKLDYSELQEDGYRVYTVTVKTTVAGTVYPMIYANSGGKLKADIYIADFTAYRQDDFSKTNLLGESAADLQNLDGWYFRDNADYKAKKELSGNSFSSKTSSVTVEDYAEKYFAVPQKKMIHFENGGVQSGFGAKLDVEKDVSYKISFKYNLVNGSFVKDNGGGIALRLYKPGSGVVDANYNAKNLDYTLSQDGGYYVYTATVKPTVTGTVYPMVYANSGGKLKADIYVADFTAYRADDTSKTNLFSESVVDFQDLSGWYFLDNAGNKSIKELSGDSFSSETSSVAAMNYADELFKKQTVKMLRITTAASGINLSQQLPGGLLGNTSYSFSVKYKIISGSLSFKVFNGGFWGAKNFEITEAETGGTEYNERTFSYTGDAGPIIGLAIPAASDIYLTDWSFYRTDDPEKTNLLTSTVTVDSLSGWMTGSNGNITNFTGSSFSGSGYTVSLEEREERLFKYTAPAVEEHKMLYIDSVPKVKYKHFGQNVNLESGKDYIISFKAKYLKGEIGNAFNLGVMNSWFGKTYFIDNASDSKALPKKTVDGWNAYEYSFKAPETADYTVGFTFVLTSKFYLADFSVYEAADSEKTNLLPAKSVTSDLSGWRSDKIKDLSGKTEFVQEDNAYTVTLLPYDESLFKLDTSHKMLHINDYGGDAFLGQNVTLKKGVSYTIAFQYRFISGDIGSGVHVAVQPMLGSGRYRAYHSTQLSDSRAFSSDYVRDDYATFTFTLQDRTYEGGSYTVNDEDTYGIGFHFSKSVELYLADFVLYETADSQKTNLLPVKNYGNGLYGWRSDWSTAAGDSLSFTDNGNKYMVDLLPYLASAFEEPAEIPGPHKMIYFQNFSDYHVVSQRVKLKAGSTYRFVISLSSTVKARAMLQHNGARNNVFGNLKPIEDPIVTGDYFTEIFEFTVPEYVGATKVNTNEMYLGIQFPAATLAYIFDAKLWDVSDPTAKNIFKNTNFDKGLDEWIITWGAWFIDGRQGTGLKTFEKDGYFKIEVMDYNEELFIPYDSDARINDGVWWKQSDVTEVVKKGTGTITGFLRSENGEGLAGVKLVLKSDEKSYSGITDANGAFVFKNIPNAFYELYVIDESGAEHYADFGYTVEIGNVITVNITVDGTYAVSTEVALARGYISGTLYTPDRKTVADKRIYIRNLGAVKTGKDGSFTFPALEPGSYELYCYDDYGNECILKTVNVQENTAMSLKLKYSPVIAVSGGLDPVYIIIICGGILCVAMIAAGIVILRKNSRKA